jgi:ribosome-binding protein aMBF1 (putative translation factor)
LKNLGWGGGVIIIHILFNHICYNTNICVDQDMYHTKKEISMLVGSRIRSLRIATGKSMITLAHESEMEYVQLSRIELGDINTTLYQLYKISKSLNVEVGELLSNL